MAAWTDPVWLAGAHAWIHRRVEERHGCVRGPIEQPHVRWWSTVLRVPTSAGVLWFKANHPTSAYEAAVVEVLADVRPDLVPGLVAVDVERGWMLMADGGERLREIHERERNLDRWFDVLPRYGELQIAVSGRAQDLVALGAPDRRLATLADDYERLVAGLDRPAAGESARLQRLAPEVREMCQALGELGIPETIQHDDLHDGQVFVRDGTYLFFDWGDSCVSHPFFSMSVTLEGVLAWGLDDIDGSVDITPFRDAYLRAFERYATPPELEEAHATALRLGWICRALNVWASAEVLEGQDREEWLDRVHVRLGMFLRGMRG